MVLEVCEYSKALQPHLPHSSMLAQNTNNNDDVFGPSEKYNPGQN
jgi:hypothetical protein